ncbi:Mur ligase family protein [Enterococcus faecium]
MTSIHSLLVDMDGHYLKKYGDLDRNIQDVEYFSGHLKRNMDYSDTMFVCVSPERRSYVNRKVVKWRDGNEQIIGKENWFGVIVTEKPIMDPSVTTPQFIVEDSWKFLLELSAKLRSCFVNPVVAITGSAGKTSTRMMITHLLQEEKVLENRGNHNVRFAVPLYMSKLLSNPDVLNLEVSVNALNSYDTGSMSNLIQPDIAIVTSIGEAHLSSLKDTKGVAVHKAKIFEGLKQDGIAIINGDIGKEEFSILVSAAEKRTRKIVVYSLHDASRDVFVKQISQKREYCEVLVSFFGEDILLKLAVSSEGMIANSLAALIVAKELKKEISPYIKKFETFKPLPKILERTIYTSETGTDFTFIDDTHNASLPSMKNAINYFDGIQPFYKGNKVLTLGQIADLGDSAKQIHRFVQEELNQSAATHIYGYGEHFKLLFEEGQKTDDRLQWFDSLQELCNDLETKLIEDSLVLAKGSVTGSDFHEIGKYMRQIGNKHNMKSQTL